jgi:uncharacterized protein (DUF1810 family)
MPSSPPQPDLTRFVEAQAPVYAAALTEIRAGCKRSHWMWFIFPQIAGLGMSAMSRHFAIRDLAEAEAYLEHPVLGPRLLECSRAALAVSGQSAQEIFGSPDDMKLRSCATLFAVVAGDDSVFGEILNHFFDGKADEATLRLIGR